MTTTTVRQCAAALGLVILAVPACNPEAGPIAAGDPANPPTITPQPTHMLLPTYTPYPTNTPYPPVTASPAPTATPTPTRTATPPPTATPAPTAIPRPTATPTATGPPSPTPEPLVLIGSGTHVTGDVALPSGIWVLDIQHAGLNNIVVWAHDSAGDRELLVNDIGRYSGSRWLAGNSEYQLEIEADGQWQFEFRKIGPELPPFSGRGDYVTGTFEPTDRVVEYSHEGRRNFVIWGHCGNSSDLVANEIGPATGSVVFRSSGLCFFEILADGNWAVAFR